MARRTKKFVKIRQLAVKLFVKLRDEGIRVDMIVLFGSYAKGKQREDSDIDLCVVSRDFGKDRIDEGASVNLIASRIDTRLECITANLYDYMAKSTISPILHEVKKHGVGIL
jgi:predicted nucleotidyltransferase